MNFRNLYRLGILAVLALFMSACSTDFEEINTNPNEPTDVPTSYLLTSAQKSFMDYTNDEWWTGRRGMQLAQHWASNQYSSESRYQLRTSVTNSYWTLFYAGSSNPNAYPYSGGGLINLADIMAKNNENPVPNSANQMAVANILASWMYQQMTDCWGNIPYSQAVQGAGNPSPSYDSQESIYRDLLSRLTNAVNSIDMGQPGPEGDIIYGGDMAKWKKFANSLKLRVAMRMADRDAAAAGAAVAEAVASGVMESNDDGAFFQYLEGSPNNHPLNEDRKTRNDFAASNVMVDVLLDLNDPRIGEFFATTVSGGDYVGEVYGLTEEDAALTADADISQRSARITSATFPGIYMDYAQVEFLLAEAVERGFINGDAATHYNNGIRASMDWWTPGADVDAYIAQPSVDYATQVAAGSWKTAIGKQKWIALHMQGIEAWTEWRRLDFGILQMPAGGTLEGNGIPKRMKYPLDEYGNNKANVEAAVAAQGADSQDTPVWWDVN